MTPPDDTQSSAQPTPAAGGSVPDAASDSGDGRWVWQYGAPPPPPSFGARFFARNASPEFLRFAFCALLVIIGCLLPWGPQELSMAGEAGAALSEAAADAPAANFQVPPTARGVDFPLGAVSLMLGIWLLYSALAGAYSGRHRILPVVLMIEPVIVTLGLLSEALDAAGDEGILRALELAGSGVLLTFAGSVLMTLQFFFLLGKVFAKKDDKAAPRRGKDAKLSKSSKGSKSGKDKDKSSKRGASKDKAGDKKTEASAEQTADKKDADASSTK